MAFIEIIIALVLGVISGIITGLALPALPMINVVFAIAVAMPCNNQNNKMHLQASYFQKLWLWSIKYL